MLRYLRKSFLIVFLYITISARCDEHEEAKKDEALTFTRGRDWIWNIYIVENFARNGYPVIVSPTATACPTESQEEQEFNDQHSLGKNSLFVREVYFPPQSTAKIDYQICETPYKMSVVYHSIADEFQFGFEVYYNKSKFLNKNAVDSKKWHYDLITNTHLKKNALENHIPTPKIYLNERTELGFLWIPMFRVEFNFESKRMAQVVYNLSPTTEREYKCDDWNLGIEYFTSSEISIDDLYSQDNQAKMLKNVKIPISKQHDEYEVIEDAACESENQCFTKWLSLPVEQLHFLATKPKSCSYLLAVPIWKSTIEDILKKLDNFLHAVSIVLGDPKGLMWIHSGVHGDLRLPTYADTTEQTLKTIKLVENDIPVPDMIYKLIRLRHTICRPKTENKKNDESADSATNDEMKEVSDKDKPKDGDKMYEPKKDNEEEKQVCVTMEAATVVVVHNNPNFDSDADKICDDRCEEWGWDEIQIREVAGRRFKSKYIYCCGAYDPKVRSKLGISNDEYIEDSRPLALGSVFLPDDHDVNIRMNSWFIRDNVIKEYKKIFEGDPNHHEYEPEEDETELIDDNDEKVLENPI